MDLDREKKAGYDGTFLSFPQTQLCRSNHLLFCTWQRNNRPDYPTIIRFIHQSWSSHFILAIYTRNKKNNAHDKTLIINYYCNSDYYNVGVNYWLAQAQLHPSILVLGSERQKSGGGVRQRALHCGIKVAARPHLVLTEHWARFIKVWAKFFWIETQKKKKQEEEQKEGKK